MAVAMATAMATPTCPPPVLVSSPSHYLIFLWFPPEFPHDACAFGFALLPFYSLIFLLAEQTGDKPDTATPLPIGQSNGKGRCGLPFVSRLSPA